MTFFHCSSKNCFLRVFFFGTLPALLDDLLMFLFPLSVVDYFSMLFEAHKSIRMLSF